MSKPILKGGVTYPRVTLGWLVVGYSKEGLEGQKPKTKRHVLSRLYLSKTAAGIYRDAAVKEHPECYEVTVEAKYGFDGITSPENTEQGREPTDPSGSP